MRSDRYKQETPKKKSGRPAIPLSNCFVCDDKDKQIDELKKYMVEALDAPSVAKYLYELKKQLKQKNKKTTTLKEIQLSVNISLHDLEIKAKKAKEFLENGDKVKVVLTMKGRELTRREESKKSFYQFLEIMMDSGIASFESAPRDEEKKCYVIFKKK